MVTGLLFAILTGLSWMLIGVFISRAAQNKLDLVTYSLIQIPVAMVISALFFVHWEKLTAEGVLLLAAFVATGGFLGSLSQIMTQNIMKRGNHGPVWGISQSAFILPFLAGVLIWGDNGTFGQWLGTLVICLGIFLPITRQFRHFGQWAGPTLLIFFIVGFLQTLHASPSRFSTDPDPANLRPLLVMAGGLSCWLGRSLSIRHHFQPDSKTIFIAVLMGVVWALSLKAFFLALDYLSSAKLGNVAMPLIVAANILGFILYARIFLREKGSSMENFGFALIIAGILCCLF